ncbi:MAG: TonB-dependent receptor plug domain-containing protein [Bryobacteraceae bacterium]|nr:TonB-dependent receptor plug domain-containing protein [Bryobacteraceae bacterium]
MILLLKKARVIPAIEVLFAAFILLHAAVPGEGAPLRRQHRTAPAPNSIRITGEELQRLLIGATADDPYGILSILSLKAGLTFRSTGDPGAENWFIVRNFGRDNSRLTLVLLDGRPVNLSNNFTVEFDDIPVAIIDSITVYFGPVPVRYGGFHTVVDIRTAEPRTKSGLASVAGGSQETARANLVLEHPGRISWLANLNFDRTMGQTGNSLSGVLDRWTYSNRRATMFNPYLKTDWKLFPFLELHAHAQLVELEKYYGEGLHYGRPQKRRRSMQGIFLEAVSPAKAATEFSLATYLNLEEESLNAQFPENPAYNVHWGDQERQRFGFLGSFARPLGARLWLSAGGEAHRSRGRTNDEYVFFRWISSQSHYGAFLEATAQPWRGAVLTAGGRLDGQTSIGRLRPAWQFALEQELMRGRLSAYAVVGKSNRWIPLNEVNTFLRPARLLGPPFLAAGFSEPARQLDFEQFRSFEGGWKLRFGRLEEARLALFAHRLAGPTGTSSFEVVPIRPAPGIPPGFAAALASFERNVPLVERSEGLEASLNTRIRPRLLMFANYSYYLRADAEALPGVRLYEGPLAGPQAQAALNQSIGSLVIPAAGRANIPGAYRMLGNLGLLGNLGRDTSFNLLGRWRGPTRDPIMKFGLDPGTNRIGGSVIWDLGLNRTVHRSDRSELAGFVKVVNLLDKRFETFVHYPMSGRTVYGGFVWSWSARASAAAPPTGCRHAR